jgi:hypothetical protein
MTFSYATNKGNSNTSSWISATGEITSETPTRFAEFLERETYIPGQIILHSPGGNLAAGLELGRMLREQGVTAHIGRSFRHFESYDKPCDTWWDEVETGLCASSCAYAFLGAKERFVDSPYYGTRQSRLGFHQFYGSPERGADMLAPAEVVAIETTTLSVAQAITGQIVLYAVEMGVDPRIVAFASATPSDDLYYPTADELDELNIASGSGLKAWFMEPYSTGLVAAAKPHRSDSMLEQITAFCRVGEQHPLFLFTMDLATPSYPNVDDLPLFGVDITIDGQLYNIPRRDLGVRYSGDLIYITVPVRSIKNIVLGAREIIFRTDNARVMGGFSESRSLEDAERSSIALAWRNCI